MRRVLPALGALLLVGGGYVTADIYDLAPGVLTIDGRPAPGRMPALPTATSGASPSGTATVTKIPSAVAAAAPLAAVSSTTPAPTAAGLKAALARTLADPALGPSVGVTVRDGTTGVHLLDLSAEVPRVPASTVKLLSAAAILTTLDPALTFSTRAVRGAGAGDVVLVAGGDTLLEPGKGKPAAVAGRAGLDDLARLTARSLKAKGITSVRLKVDESYAAGPRYAPRWSSADINAGLVGPVAMLGLSTERPTPGSPGSTEPGMSTARAFARALRARGLTVSAAIDRAVAPDAAPELGAVRSAPLADVLALALSDSDNALTESLARQATVKAGRAASFAAVTTWVRESLTAKRIDMDHVTLADTSGLSHGTLVPVRALGDVLSLAAGGKEPALQDVVARLPVAGLTGTLATRFSRASTHTAAGIARAKSGTLTGASALAGSVVDKDGRMLTFAIVVDRVAPGVGTLSARAALDRFVATLASCGCR